MIRDKVHRKDAKCYLSWQRGYFFNDTRLRQYIIFHERVKRSGENCSMIYTKVYRNHDLWIVRRAWVLFILALRLLTFLCVSLTMNNWRPIVIKLQEIIYTIKDLLFFDRIDKISNSRWSVKKKKKNFDKSFRIIIRIRAFSLFSFTSRGNEFKVVLSQSYLLTFPITIFDRISIPN